MKILHAADLHLDTPFTGRTEAEVAYLKEALLSVPGKIVELCQKESCDLMLLAGDLFDALPTPESLRALKTALGEAGVPVLISPGNHDFCGADSPYLSEIWPENVHIFTKNAIESIVLPALDCRVYGAGFISMDCPALLENFRAEGSETYHIGLLHGDPLQKNSPYCPVSQTQVAASGLQYLALGHIHKEGAFVAGSTLCAWPGCPMGRGNDETGPKGVYIVHLADRAEVEFRFLDTPRFHDLEVEVFDTPENAVRAVLPPVGNRDFYRITLVGESAPFDPAALSFPAFPHLQLRDRTVPPVDLWASIHEDTLEGVFFRMLHESLATEDEETVMLAAKITRKLLDGREVALP